jgi:hypothetical protein
MLPIICYVEGNRLLLSLDGACKHENWGAVVSAQLIHNNSRNTVSQLVKCDGCVDICHDTNNIQQR